jgi:hypothetical protein
MPDHHLHNRYDVSSFDFPMFGVISGYKVLWRFFNCATLHIFFKDFSVCFTTYNSHLLIL